MDFNRFIPKNKLVFFLFIILIIGLFFRIDSSKEFLLENPEQILIQGENERNATKIKMVFYHYWYAKNNRKKALQILEKSKIPEIKIFFKKWKNRHMDTRGGIKA